MSAPTPLPPRFLRLLRRREELYADRQAIQHEIESIDEDIRRAMGDEEEGACGPFSVFLRRVQVSRLSQKLLRELHPRVWKRCCRQDVVRRLHITRKEVV